ncbi:MAG: mechanosensitive ion channel family protein [Elusimicrobiota bacterium]
MSIVPFWDATYFGNTVAGYGTAAAILLGGVMAVWLADHFVASRLKKWADSTETLLDDFLVDMLEKTLVPLLYFGVLYLSLQGLSLNPAVHKLVSVLGALLLTVLGVNFLRRAVRFLILGYWLKKRADADLERQVAGLMPVLTVVLWGVGVVFLLDNLGFEISAVIAGLGIGGVAVALAAQAVLGDLFSYFAIMMDRPFELGDFIILDNYMGTVEHIGIKTTRIRSLGGEQLVFSNTDLTGSRLRNYKRMQIRRVVFKLGVTYDTPVEKLRELPAVLKDIVVKAEQTRFDRAHFYSYGDFSLVFEVVYFVLSSDYNVYMDVQQKINFAIKEAFEARGVEFAFPTQTIHVQRSGSADEPAAPRPAIKA